MAENALDIFSSDAFGVISMTRALELMPAVPSRIGQMGLFADEGVPTNTVEVEEINQTLHLLATRARGVPGVPAQHDKRTVRSIAIPHIPHTDTVLAAEVQGVRAMGSASRLQTISDLVNRRLKKMRLLHELTLEYHRAGALQGLVKDADGSTLYNLHTLFGVSRPSVDFALGTAGTEIINKCDDVIHAIETALGQAPYTGIHALCGRTWFNALKVHAKVTAAYARWQDGAYLRSTQRKGFPFGEITFEPYYRKVGAKYVIPDNEAVFFPLGVPDLFVTHFGPADYIETVNTVGRPLYAKQERLDLDKGILIETQSNPLCLCHRPGVLVQGTTST